MPGKTVAKVRVQTRYVRRTAARAIGQRGGQSRNSIISCERDPSEPSMVLLHLNSGGNGLAAEQALRADGYYVEWDKTSPSYGVLLHVGPALATTGTPA